MNATRDITPRDLRNSKSYIALMFLWAVVYCAATFALAGGYVESAGLRWLAALIPSVFAAIAVRAYWRYLDGMDELMRMIELKAIARALSVGFIAWPAVELLKVGIPLEFDVPLVMLIICAVYSFNIVKGRMETR